MSTVSIMGGMNKRKYFYCAVKNFYHSMTFCYFTNLAGFIYLGLKWIVWMLIGSSIQNPVHYSAQSDVLIFDQILRFIYLVYWSRLCSTSILRSIYLFLKADLQCLYPTSLLPYTLSYLIINVYLQNAITYILQGIDFQSK